MIETRRLKNVVIFVQTISIVILYLGYVRDGNGENAILLVQTVLLNNHCCCYVPELIFNIINL